MSSVPELRQRLVDRLRPLALACRAPAGRRRWAADRWWAAGRPADPTPGLPPLFSVIAACDDGDVIEATVANAFVQGCTRVLLVDGGSADDTVARALAAGAELAGRHRGDRADRRARSLVVDDVIREVSQADGAAHIWWLRLEGHELPAGRGGRTVGQHVAGLHPAWRVVGARFLDHFPTGPVANLAGFHPIDVQPYCARLRAPLCVGGHAHHPLVRFDRDAGPAQLPGGLAPPATGDGRPRWPDPVEPILVHHFLHRDEVDRGGTGNVVAVAGERAVVLSDWRSMVAPADRALPRWYDQAQLAAALDRRRAELGERSCSLPGPDPRGPGAARRPAPTMG